MCPWHEWAYDCRTGENDYDPASQAGSFRGESRRRRYSARSGQRVPELPEVETVVRTLAPQLTGRRIVDAQFSSHHVVRQNFAVLRNRVRNQPVKSVRRHGKFIVLELDRGSSHDSSWE